MRAFVKNVAGGIVGASPVYCVGDYALNIGIVEGFAGLMTGLEVKYLSRTADEASSGTEDIAVLKPRAEYERIGLGNVEGLGVELLFLDQKMLGDACGNGMGGVDVPHDLVEVVAPKQVAGSTYHTAEHLGIVAGVEDD